MSAQQWVFNSGLQWERLCLPNGGFLRVLTADHVMSSIVGPSLDSVLPMTILPMDVIMVSRYTSPVSSSFTTWLEETLDMPGFDTIPRVITLTGMFRSTSTSSGVLKQAATPAKPQGGVGGLTNANALASGGDLGGDEALGALGGGLKGMVLVGRRTLLLACGTVVGQGTSPVAITGGMGVIPHPA